MPLPINGALRKSLADRVSGANSSDMGLPSMKKVSGLIIQRTACSGGVCPADGSLESMVGQPVGKSPRAGAIISAHAGFAGAGLVHRSPYVLRDRLRARCRFRFSVLHYGRGGCRPQPRNNSTADTLCLALMHSGVRASKRKDCTADGPMCDDTRQSARRNSVSSALAPAASRGFLFCVRCLQGDAALLSGCRKQQPARKSGR